MHQQFIPLSVPNFKGNELSYVTDAIETEWVSTSGKYVNDFEKRIAEYVGVNNAVSCQSGTAGIHISLILAGVGTGDEVIVPALTFIAAINPVRYVGAEPVFMDCDESLSMDPIKLEQFIEAECTFVEGSLINNATKKRIKAIVVVHVFGNLAKMNLIMEIAKKYSIIVIEDATEALGTFSCEDGKQKRFAGTIGDIGVYSFNGNKIITTGGGGMIVSNNEEWLNRAKHLTTQAKIDELHYFHDEVGFNYRMTNLQAALGLAQLEQLEEFIQIKKNNYEYYKERISKKMGIRVLDFRTDTRPNYWFYSLYIEDAYPKRRDQLIQFLHERNIQTRPIWGLIHLQKPYIKNQSYNITKANEYWERVINIPCSSKLIKKDIDYIIGQL